MLYNKAVVKRSIFINKIKGSGKRVIEITIWEREETLASYIFTKIQIIIK